MLASSQFRDQDFAIDRANYTLDELYLEAKHRYLTSLKGIYWEFFEHGQCSSRACLLLIGSADRAIDHSEDTLKDFHVIKKYFGGGWFVKCLLKLKKV